MAGPRYGKVINSIYWDPVFAALSDYAKLLLLFLLTCREATIIPGVIIIGVAAAAESLGWNVTKAKKAFAELIDAGLVHMDAQARLVFIPNSLLTDMPESYKNVAAWVRVWIDVPDCPLKWKIWEMLHNAARILAQTYGHIYPEAFERACPGKGIRYPSDGYPEDTGSGIDPTNLNKTPALDQEQEPVLEQDLQPNQSVGPGQVSAGSPPGSMSPRGNDGAGLGASQN